MKGTHEDIIKALRCSAENYSDYCKSHSCERKLKGKPMCPYRQPAYQGTAYNPRLYKDAAELLEHYQEIDRLYLEKCKEVNELKRIVSGNFSPEEYVKWHNVLVAEESHRNAEPFLEHEHI